MVACATFGPLAAATYVYRRYLLYLWILERLAGGPAPGSLVLRLTIKPYGIRVSKREDHRSEPLSQRLPPPKKIPD